AGGIEGITLGRLHLDAIAVAGAGVEFEARDGEALRPPPLGELVRSAEGAKHNRATGRDDPPELERQLARPRHHVWPYGTLRGAAVVSPQASSMVIVALSPRPSLDRE